MLVLVGCTAAAQDLESWHTVDTALVERGRFELTGHFQFRSRQSFNQLHYMRTGPVVRWNVSNRASLVGGYYVHDAQQQDEWRASHRTFGGVELVPIDRRYTVSTRLAVERFFGGTGEAFTRFRQNVRISGNSRVAPVAGVEYFIQKIGIATIRPVVGVRFQVHPWARLDLLYYYDARHPSAGPHRQMVATAIRFSKPEE